MPDCSAANAGRSERRSTTTASDAPAGRQATGPATGPSDEPAAAALRRGTADRHEAIETLLRLDESLDLPRYRRTLVGFESFHAGWEPLIRAALPPRLLDWFAARSRLGFLRADLRALGLRSAAAAADAFEAWRPADIASALGSIYVVEGSALGGQIIARRLASAFGLDPATGAAYFNGWGGATGAMWREFRERLDAELGTSRAARAAAVAAARHTFDALIGTFARLPAAAAMEPGASAADTREPPN